MSDVDERAALDGELPDALELAVADNQALPDALALFEDEGDTPDFDRIKIKNISVFGKGCSEGTFDVEILEDEQAFNIRYEDMEFENPGGSPIKTMNCAASIELHIPDGWRIGLATINTRGWAFLEEGIVAQSSAKYIAHTLFKGPYADFHTSINEVPLESKVWSKCGGSSLLVVDTSLDLSFGSDATGLVSVGDAVVVHVQLQVTQIHRVVDMMITDTSGGLLLASTADGTAEFAPSWSIERGPPTKPCPLHRAANKPAESRSHGMIFEHRGVRAQTRSAEQAPPWFMASWRHRHHRYRRFHRCRRFHRYRRFQPASRST